MKAWGLWDSAVCRFARSWQNSGFSGHTCGNPLIINNLEAPAIQVAGSTRSVGQVIVVVLAVVMGFWVMIR